MKFYSLLLLIMISPICKCIKFDQELQKNILRFGYGTNYKYEGMLTHSFDRFLYHHKIHIALDRRYKIFKLRI